MNFAEVKVTMHTHKAKWAMMIYAFARVVKWRWLANLVVGRIAWYRTESPIHKDDRWHALRLQVGQNFELTSPLPKVHAMTGGTVVGDIQ